mgnify:CR=1 FL=1
MQFDYVIQVGVWVGSADQIACVRQTASDANFEDYASIEAYLEQIEASHNEEGTDGSCGPIDHKAQELDDRLFSDAWKRSH